MTSVQAMICDGCGQTAGPDHLACRFRRLELTTRYRPIHVQAVFLGANPPNGEEEFLYSAKQGFQGEAAALLDALKIEHAGRAPESVLTEFQRKGFLLAHVLECPIGAAPPATELTSALRNKLPGFLKRLRTSLRPKRVVVFSLGMQPIISELKTAQTSSEIVLDGDSPFELSGPSAQQSASRLRSAL